MFNRTPEGLKLSRRRPAGAVQAEQVEGQIDDIERMLVGRDQRLQGHVRVTFPEPVGTGFLMRDLGRFVDAYPEISLDFIGSYEALSLTRGEADIAVRVTDAPPEHLVGRRLGHFAVAVYASNDYLTKHDPHSTTRTVQLGRLGRRALCRRSGAAARVSRRSESYPQSRVRRCSLRLSKRVWASPRCRAYSPIRIRR